MSIDPTILPHSNLSNVMPIDHLPITEEGIYVFDFDGVIASNFEDCIYRLPPQDSELEIIAAAADEFGIRCAGMEQRYQRHLVYQAAAWKLQRPIDAGPGLISAQNASSIAPFFVLTARSGWYALERLRAFLTDQKIVPVEIFNVGRVPKDRQLRLLTKEFHSKTVFFVDDSLSHLADAQAMSLPNLSLVHAFNDLQFANSGLPLYKHFRETVDRALSLSIKERTNARKFARQS